MISYIIWACFGVVSLLVISYLESHHGIFEEITVYDFFLAATLGIFIFLILLALLANKAYKGAYNDRIIEFLLSMKNFLEKVIHFKLKEKK